MTCRGRQTTEFGLVLQAWMALQSDSFINVGNQEELQEALMLVIQLPQSFHKEPALTHSPPPAGVHGGGDDASPAGREWRRHQEPVLERQEEEGALAGVGPP